MNTHWRGAFLIFFGWLGAAGTRALADPVDVGNPSFESPELSPGAYIIGSFDSWDATDTAGVFYPAPWFRQWRLSVDANVICDLANPSTYSVELYAGTELLGSESSQDPTPGDFAISTVIFTSGDPDPLEGEPLQIVLRSTQQEGSQIAFDLVTLDATPAG